MVDYRLFYWSLANKSPFYFIFSFILFVLRTLPALTNLSSTLLPTIDPTCFSLCLPWKSASILHWFTTFFHPSASTLHWSLTSFILLPFVGCFPASLASHLSSSLLYTFEWNNHTNKIKRNSHTLDRLLELEIIVVATFSEKNPLHRMQN